jgi:hypothetical protein
VKIVFSLILFFCCLKSYSQHRDSLDITLKKNILSVNYRLRTLPIKTTQQLDSFLNKNTENLKNLDKTKIVLWFEDSNDTLSGTIFNMLVKKYKINTFAYYSDVY